MPQRPPLYSPTVLAIIIANAFPLAGVFLLGWDPRTILLIYWSESVVIGVINVAKMGRIDPFHGYPLALLFWVHYGLCVACHLLLILGLTSGSFGEEGMGLRDIDIAAAMRDAFAPIRVRVAVAVLFAAHVYTYYRDYILEDGPLADWPTQQMFAPYPRFFVMHGILVIAAIIVLITGAPALVLPMAIAVKTVLEVRAERLANAEGSDDDPETPTTV